MALSAAAEERGRKFPADRGRYPDPATEFEVVRLTDPSYSSWLPSYLGRAVSQRSNALVFASDRPGSLQALTLDLKTGESRQVTEAAALDPGSLVLAADDRTIFYLDGRALFRADLASLRSREVYRVPSGFDPAPQVAVSSDLLYALLVETAHNQSRLRLVRLATGGATTVVESPEPVSNVTPRPRRAGILYRRAQSSYWLVNYDGRDNRPMRLAPGDCGPAHWARDGRTFTYLSGKSLREFTPDTNTGKLVAPTSQFVHYGCNADGSVFIGASGSKAQPFVLLLLRATKREFTLCEHKASDPLMVAPAFDPSSQRILFNSDRHGKPAIYLMSVARIVEKTG